MSLLRHHQLLMSADAAGPYIPPDAPPGTTPFPSPGEYWNITTTVGGYSYGYDPVEQKWFATRTDSQSRTGSVSFVSMSAYDALSPTYLVLEITIIGADGNQSFSNSVRPNTALGGPSYNSEPNAPGPKLFTFPSSQVLSPKRLEMHKFYNTTLGDGFIVNFAGYIP